ncbi:GNAT family N-acetyltransferase [Neobacillus drentensis]|uniref:GNAT family N-acetyltransferase n=1 Tax=Neobacillus drentensis TaxID=220684 RepID=UPI0028658330|nr:GNAT family N-acetyltransferase [Neobacillus drentensis]MDR7238747.1 RimJ/RimL family protein N-acetyltransferase [Neobacillus drentensis]
MTTNFIKLTEPSSSILEVLNRWDNDPTLIPLTRPNPNQAELDRRENMSLADLTKRMEDHHIYLIYHNDQLIGEMNYIVDPPYLFKKEPGTAWIGITIGEAIGRGQGIGYAAIQYIEEQIKKQGLHRVELGVFEFNQQAQKLYQKLGYKEIGRVEKFTYWQGQMWTDIRMEKFI